MGDTSAVGIYPLGASPYGAMVMAGNVAEWINDWWSDSYYSASPYSNPPGPSAGDQKVVCGGGWCNIAISLRAFDRQATDPEGTGDQLGFRCAESLP